MNESKIFFVSDTHFQHSKIIEYASRPFKDITEMNEKLIENWNRVVGRGDLIYHLGDFGWKDSEPIIKRLNGQKFLIRGNHDTEGERLKKYWNQITPIKTIKHEDITITLCHYALRVWEASHFGTWHLYGHSHGNLLPHGLSLDVGVDIWNYTPVSFEQIKEKMLKLKASTEDARYSISYE